MFGNLQSLAIREMQLRSDLGLNYGRGLDCPSREELSRREAKANEFRFLIRKYELKFTNTQVYDGCVGD